MASTIIVDAFAVCRLQNADSKRHSVGSQSSRQSSAQLLHTVTEPEQVAARELSPRDSGFEGAASSLKFDSRPTSVAASVVPKLETEQVKFCLPLSSVCVNVIQPCKYYGFGTVGVELTFSRPA